MKRPSFRAEGEGAGKSRYLIAPEAALDLVRIWRFIKKRSSLEMADHVESVIREKIVFLAGNPNAGHWRKNLTNQPVRFFPVYSYLIVYRPEAKPLQVVAVLHGRRDIERLLKSRV
jgi:plasmid stabilization system protein ParE